MSLGLVYHEMRTYVLVGKRLPVLTALGGTIPHCVFAASYLLGELVCKFLLI